MFIVHIIIMIGVNLIAISMLDKTMNIRFVNVFMIMMKVTIGIIVFLIITSSWMSSYYLPLSSRKEEPKGAFETVKSKAKDASETVVDKSKDVVESALWWGPM